MAELRAAFPGVVVNVTDGVVPAFYVSDSFTGFVSGDGDADVIETVIGGVACSG